MSACECGDHHAPWSCLECQARLCNKCLLWNYDDTIVCPRCRAGPPTTKKKKPIAMSAHTFRMDAETSKKLTALAKRTGIGRSAMVRKLIKEATA